MAVTFYGRSGNLEINSGGGSTPNCLAFFGRSENNQVPKTRQELLPITIGNFNGFTYAANTLGIVSEPITSYKLNNLRYEGGNRVVIGDVMECEDPVINTLADLSAGDETLRISLTTSASAKIVRAKFTAFDLNKPTLPQTDIVVMACEVIPTISRIYVPPSMHIGNIRDNDTYQGGGHFEPDATNESSPTGKGYFYPEWKQIAGDNNVLKLTDKTLDSSFTYNIGISVAPITAGYWINLGFKFSYEIWPGGYSV